MQFGVFKCSRCGKRIVSAHNLNGEMHQIFTAVAPTDKAIFTDNVSDNSITKVEKCGTWMRER